ncbi:hypothetical protein AAG570_003618 [Ranatra chinensis]|uniref:Major facilitator superfamily (MFS) profile domain-containing protein n=1 Tax=Ranatra chinensis TaxID=642074 RepID=A0ABD0YQY5_9HEMI
MSLGFSAIALGQLRLNVNEASWFASVTAMSYPLGSILIGPVMDKLGRRPALLSIDVLSFFGWLMLSVHTTSPSIAKLIIGRVLTGIAGGLASVPASVYSAECLSPGSLSIRSSLVTWSTVALSAGIFLVYGLGSLMPYYAVGSIATLFSITSLILVAIFIPESPAWLTSKGRLGDAEWSQKELNLVTTPSTSERTEAEDSEDGSPLPHEPPLPPPRTLQEMLRPEAYKPLLIMIFFFFFQQFSGVYVLLAYTVDVVRSADVVTVNPYLVTALGGTIILVVSLLASLIYPKTGVRAIATVSGAGMAATMLFLGLFHAFRDDWSRVPTLYFLNWIPFFVILGNIALSTLGFLILPWSMLGEVFPLNVKGLAAGIATCFGFLFSFAAVKLYPYLRLGLGVSGMFFFFGTMAVFGTIFVVFFLPETKGKTLEEIVEGFSKPRRR